MKLWFDGQCLQTPSSTRGIGRYARGLLTALAGTSAELNLTVSLNAALDIAPALAQLNAIPGLETALWESVPGTSENFLGRDRRWSLSALSLCHHIGCINPDLAISLSPYEGSFGPVVPFEPPPGFPFATAAIFYDAIPHRFRDQFMPNLRSRSFFEARLAALSHFNALLCISESSAEEARGLVAGVCATNISTGIDHFHQADSSPLATTLPQEPFLVYVGSLDWHKNVGIVPEAIALLPVMGGPLCSFLVAGEHEAAQRDQLRRQWMSLGLDPTRLHFPGYLADGELLCIYQRAGAVIQPSLFEGFGLPAAEAMGAGALVVAARTGALPEVVGDSKLLFEPDRADELATVLATMFAAPQARAEAVARGREHIRQFTWNRTARRALSALEGVPRKLGFQTLRDARSWSFSKTSDLRVPASLIAEALARAEPPAMSLTSKTSSTKSDIC